MIVLSSFPILYNKIPTADTVYRIPVYGIPFTQFDHARPNWPWMVMVFYVLAAAKTIIRSAKTFTETE